MVDFREWKNSNCVWSQALTGTSVGVALTKLSTIQYHEDTSLRVHCKERSTYHNASVPSSNSSSLPQFREPRRRNIQFESDLENNVKLASKYKLDPLDFLAKTCCLNCRSSKSSERIIVLEAAERLRVSLCAPATLMGSALRNCFNSETVYMLCLLQVCMWQNVS